jgi:hypothetical protein
MRLPRRGKTDPEDSNAVQGFWTWWDAGGHLAADKGIAGSGFDTFIAKIDPLVKAIHSELQWELAPGNRAEHGDDDRPARARTAS